MFCLQEGRSKRWSAYCRTGASSIVAVRRRVFATRTHDALRRVIPEWTTCTAYTSQQRAPTSTSALNHVHRPSSRAELRGDPGDGPTHAHASRRDRRVLAGSKLRGKALAARFPNESKGAGKGEVGLWAFETGVERSTWRVTCMNSDWCTLLAELQALERQL
jgi:hypothetical protein